MILVRQLKIADYYMYVIYTGRGFVLSTNYSAMTPFYTLSMLQRFISKQIILYIPVLSLFIRRSQHAYNIFLYVTKITYKTPMHAYSRLLEHKTH